MQQSCVQHSSRGGGGSSMSGSSAGRGRLSWQDSSWQPCLGCSCVGCSGVQRCRQQRHQKRVGSHLTAAVTISGFSICKEQMWEPAVELAALSQQFWQLPAQRAAAAEQLGRAAAACSCAYRRCPNLALEGDPAAGEGRGTRRCGGCRVAWYCSTACSLVESRAGHWRVRKALAAVRGQLVHSSLHRMPRCVPLYLCMLFVFWIVGHGTLSFNQQLSVALEQLSYPPDQAARVQAWAQHAGCPTTQPLISA